MRPAPVRPSLKYIAGILLISAFACEEKKQHTAVPTIAFQAQSLRVAEGGVRKLRGQLLYMPVYSDIPNTDGRNFALSAFLAIHNTDLSQSIQVTRVTLFNTEGQAVKEYLSAEKQLGPMATAVFSVPRTDQSGTGANFLVEWVSEKPVTEPLIESIMKDLGGNLGLSFLSHGKVIREAQ
jgi:hypothetical protein